MAIDILFKTLYNTHEHIHDEVDRHSVEQEGGAMSETTSIRRIIIFTVIVISVFTLGVADQFTGWEFGFFIFYFIPIALTAWMLGLRHSIGISVLSAIVWFFSDYYSGRHYSHALYGYWNAVIRLMAFLAVSFSTSYYQLFRRERIVSNELKEALNSVKTLRGLIPICASCKKIRDDEGYWKQVEEYIGTHSEARFSHGLCPDCLKKYREEAGLVRKEPK
jgi:hypothetical protein